MSPSRRELRKFGLTVGGLLLAFAVIKIWRHGPGPSRYALASVGGVLLTLGALWPSVLGPTYRLWMRVATALGWVNTRVILSVVFFAVLTPLAVIVRLIRRDPLERRRRAGNRSYWFERTTPVDPERYKRQF